MTRRNALPETLRATGELRRQEGSAARARRAGGRSRLLAATIGVLTLLAAACGEDGNDAPGGSAPPASTPQTDSSAGPGPGSPDTGPSPEAADEGHPSVPAAAVETTEGG